MENFKFEMSLSVLNHLGRNLYRNFITVLGEVISNAWDADANNVRIYINKEDKLMKIIDDGIGMTPQDFQQKFLRVGHTKRDERDVSLIYSRPYIGRKGIGKLALLSCSEKFHIASKSKNGDVIGGSIDNSDLNLKIAEGGELGEYSLETISSRARDLLSSYSQGTAMIFEEIKADTINSLDHVKKSLALYFQFAMLDEDFNIYVNDEKVTIDNLQKLVSKTQMIWRIGSFENELTRRIQELDDWTIIHEKNVHTELEGLRGFIATVDTPSSLKISGIEGGQVTLDLFVNGRIREKDLLKHFPTKRVVESYVYGQIHYDVLDKGSDAFTSSREGVIVSDPRFQKLIKEIEKIFRKIMDQWDYERVKNRKKGDPDGPALDKRERPAREMIQAILEENFAPFISKKRKKRIGTKSEDKKSVTTTNRNLVEGWVIGNVLDAAYNAKSYATCFIVENLLRDFIKYKNKENEMDVRKYRDWEEEHKKNAGIDYEVRQKTEDIFYAGMDELVEAIMTKDEKSTHSGIYIHKLKFRPLRNAVAHTALLTREAKNDLEINFTNIKERLVKKLDEFTIEEVLELA